MRHGLYGHRARIGYCSPPFVTETFVYEFYRMAPEGVTLMITTLEVGNAYTPEAFAGSQERSQLAARAMAVAGADVVVLGGNPVNQSLGVENLPALCAALEAEIGIPVVTSTLAQRDALVAVGARKVATGHMAGPEHDARVRRQTEAMGFESAGVLSGGAWPLMEYGRIPESAALPLGRELQRRFPDADALHFANAHWPTIAALDPLERELGLPVISAAQAIVWAALRAAGIDDRIDGFGRLLRDA